MSRKYRKTLTKKRKEEKMLLIVSKPKTQAEDLSDLMNFMGVLSLAATPTEAIFEISENYRALIVIPDEKTDDNIKDALLLSAKDLNVPSFSLGEGERESKFDFHLKETLSAAEILDAVIERCKAGNFKPVGEYKNSDVDASLSRGKAFCFSESVSLTKTEAMIVRVLLRFYPSPVKAHEILKLAFRKKRSPDEASIRTHISKINKKCMKISGRTLISNFEKLGYTLSKNEFSLI